MVDEILKSEVINVEFVFINVINLSSKSYLFLLVVIYIRTYWRIDLSVTVRNCGKNSCNFAQTIRIRSRIVVGDSLEFLRDLFTMSPQLKKRKRYSISMISFSVLTVL